MNEKTKEDLKINIRKLYGVKTSHYVNFEPRLTQLMELIEEATGYQRLSESSGERQTLRKLAPTAPSPDKDSL